MPTAGGIPLGATLGNVSTQQAPTPLPLPERFANWVKAHKPSLKVQFFLAFLVAAVAIVALIRFVDSENPKVEQASSPSQSQFTTEQQEDEVIVRQQQAPHVTKLPAGRTPLQAIDSAVRRFVSYEVARGIFGGPFKSATCVADGVSSSRLLYRCKAVTAALTYPFDGVVDRAQQQVVYCQVVQPPIPSMKMPAISSRCL